MQAMRRFLVVCLAALLFGACGDDAGLPETLAGDWESSSATALEVDVYLGHEHCQTQDLAELQLHNTATGQRTYYLRDADDSMRKFSVHAPKGKFARLDKLPADAQDIGFRRGDAALWLEPDKSAAYLAFEDTVERWPRWEWSLGYCD